MNINKNYQMHTILIYGFDSSIDSILTSLFCFISSSSFLFASTNCGRKFLALESTEKILETHNSNEIQSIPLLGGNFSKVGFVFGIVSAGLFESTMNGDARCSSRDI